MSPQAQVLEDLLPGWWHWRRCVVERGGLWEYVTSLYFWCISCFVFAIEDMSSQRLAPATMPAACCHASLTFWTLIPPEP